MNIQELIDKLDDLFEAFETIPELDSKSIGDPVDGPEFSVSREDMSNFRVALKLEDSWYTFRGNKETILIRLKKLWVNK